MSITVGMRELARNSNILDDYDYVDVEDKKTHKYKGLFISPKYADEFKSYLIKKQAKEKKQELNEIMKFAGILSGESENLTSKEIKESKKVKYFDK